MISIEVLVKEWYEARCAFSTGIPDQRGLMDTKLWNRLADAEKALADFAARNLQ